MSANCVIGTVCPVIDHLEEQGDWSIDVFLRGEGGGFSGSLFLVHFSGSLLKGILLKIFWFIFLVHFFWFTFPPTDLKLAPRKTTMASARVIKGVKQLV